MHRVVITGMGAVTPFGTGVKPLWDGVVENRLAITPIDTFDASPLSVHFAGQVHDFDPAGCLDKKDARIDEVVDEVYELFMDLEANDDQLDFPIHSYIEFFLKRRHVALSLAIVMTKVYMGS